jgi:lipoprotein-anchoring transpeptidase ErfK/SrfK
MSRVPLVVLTVLATAAIAGGATAVVSTAAGRAADAQPQPAVVAAPAVADGPAAAAGPAAAPVPAAVPAGGAPAPAAAADAAKAPAAKPAPAAAPAARPAAKPAARAAAKPAAKPAARPAAKTPAKPAAKPARAAAGIVPGTPCAVTVRACIDLAHNKAWLISNGAIEYGPVAITSGRKGYRTPVGTFHVLSRERMHLSRAFDNAPMPWSVFFIPGIAFHQGSLAVPSHGCIHLSKGAAQRFFAELHIGDVVQAVR